MNSKPNIIFSENRMTSNRLRYDNYTPHLFLPLYTVPFLDNAQLPRTKKSDEPSCRVSSA